MKRVNLYLTALALLVVFNLKAQTPAAPTKLRVVPVYTNIDMSLVWRDNANNETGFKIERKSGGGAFAQIATNVNYLGRRRDSTTMNFNGYMDCLGVWNKQLTSTEVNEIYTQNMTYLNELA